MHSLFLYDHRPQSSFSPSLVYFILFTLTSIFLSVSVLLRPTSLYVIPYFFTFHSTYPSHIGRYLLFPVDPLIFCVCLLQLPWFFTCIYPSLLFYSLPSVTSSYPHSLSLSLSLSYTLLAQLLPKHTMKGLQPTYVRTHCTWQMGAQLPFHQEIP